MSQWRIELLGAIRAISDKLVISKFRAHKAKLLLAYLACHMNRPHQREILISILWPEADFDAARISLRVELSSLRHQLEPPGCPAGSVIVADRSSIQLNPQTVSTDLAEFESAIRQATGNPSAAERVQYLSRAIDLFRGEFLSGSYEDWVIQEQYRTANLYNQALDDIIVLLGQSGEVDRSLEYAHKMIRHDQLCESGYLHVMRLHALRGQVHSAMQQFHELERLLQSEAGERPSKTACELASKIGEMKKSARSGATELIVVPDDHHKKHPAQHPEDKYKSPSTITILVSETSEDKGQDAASFLRETADQFRGREISRIGNSISFTFERASDALGCAIAVHLALDGAVRTAIHTGETDPASQDAKKARHRENALGELVDVASQILIAAHQGQILCSEVTAALLNRSNREESWLEPLGTYRLRNVHSPERIFQVCDSDMPVADYPPIMAERYNESNVPPVYTRFFGREEELRELQSRLSVVSSTSDYRNLNRLITISGPGGCGKTRLAIELANQLAGTWGETLWFVPLADISNPAAFLPAIVEAMGLPSAPRSKPLNQLVCALEQKRALLILDNIEQLLPEAALHVRSLLTQVPSLVILVTSRGHLELEGELEFPLRSLPVPKSADTVEELSSSPAVQLFADRARATMPHFRVTEANAQSVTDLCHLLEGMPLAIELAAASIGVLSCAQMVEETRKSLDWLKSRHRDTDSRHRTLQATMEWSYRLLSPELQELFVKMSVFRGGWTHDAAEQISLESRCLEYLSDLQECSMIFAEEAGEHRRFRMLETLRRYAIRKIADDDLKELHLRHSDYFAGLAEQAEVELAGPKQISWLRQLESDYDNIRAAVQYALDSKRAEIGLRLVTSLDRFWQIRGHLDEATDWLTELLAAYPSRDSNMAKGLVVAGDCAKAKGDMGSAKLLYTRALEVACDVKSTWAETRALYGLAQVMQSAGEYEKACKSLIHAVDMSRKSSDADSLAWNLWGLGLLMCSKNDRLHAHAHWEEALEIRRTMGDKWGTGLLLHGLSDFAASRGEYSRARDLLQESLRVYNELGDKWGAAWTLNMLSHRVHPMGELVEAEELALQGLDIFRTVGHKEGVAGCLWHLSLIYRDMGDHSRARKALAEATESFTRAQYSWGIGACLDAQALLASDAGDYQTARELHLKSIKLSNQHGNQLSALISRTYLGDLLNCLGIHIEAESTLRQCVEEWERVGDVSWLAFSRNCLGEVHISLGNLEQARECLEASLQMRRQAGLRLDKPSSLESLAALAAASGNSDDSRAFMDEASEIRASLKAPIPHSKKVRLNSAIAAINKGKSLD